MEFEWDPRKAILNERKHKVTFQEASTIFLDSLAITFADPDHSAIEFRFLTFGMSTSGRLFIVSHFDRGDKTRIVSARLTTRYERKIYEEG